MAGVVMGALAMSAGHGARAQAIDGLLAAAQPQPFTADDVLWLEVRLEGQPLAESMDAYSSRAGVFVPLGQFSRLLDLAVGVFPAQQRAEGWVLTRDRLLVVDLIAGEAQVGGRTIPIAANQAAIFDDELFVRLDLAEQLLPVRLTADPSAQLLDVRATEPLPFQSRLERERRRLGLEAGPGEIEAATRVETPYRLFTPPTVDVNLGGQLTRDGDDQLRRYDVRLAGDLAYAGFQGFLGSDEDGELSSVRVLLERKDPSGRALGALGGTRAGIGDVFTPSMALGAASYGGRGLYYSSAPLESLDLATPLTLRGELAVGEEVELYVNEILQGARSAPEQGRYEFRNVPLRVGLNTIRLVFYGSQGQTREQVRRINFGSGQVEAGRTVVRLGLVEQGLPVIDAGAPIADASAGEARLVATVDHGLTAGLTVSGGAALYTPREGEARSLAMLGLRGSLGSIATQVDAAVDDQGGHGVALGAAARPWGVSVLARHAEYGGGFIDETRQLGVSAAEPLVRSSTLRADFQVQPIAGLTLPVSLDMRRAERMNGERQTVAELRSSAAVDRYYLSGSVIYEDEVTAQGRTERVLGGADLATLVNAAVQLRGGFTYEISPDARLDTAYVNADVQISETDALRLGAVRALGASGETSLQASYLRRARRFDIALNAAYETRSEEWRVGLQLGLALAWDSGRGRYAMVRPGASTGGAVAVNAWVDRDGDGVRDADEPAVPGVVVESPAEAVLTDADGQAFATGLGDGAAARVRLNAEGIEDPFLIGGPSTFELTPRAGRVAQIAYPMVPGAEVEITALLARDGGEARPLSALDLELVGADGAVIATRTDHAGVAFLEAVRPGDYAVRLNPEQAATLGLELAAPARLTVPAEGGFVRGDDIVVRLTGGAE
ncbi:hypothetical protein [Brevundimonas sp.]|uniref:hypothetical protein n=1 Tax=Brevundimonas sp. TaxID=1871086 RepID=UPI0035B3D6AC